MDAKLKQKIAKRLERIAQESGGRLTPDAVIADARDPKSPLHSQFEWDDTVAAEQWRRQQARGLIARVHLVHKINRTIIKAPHYVRDPAARGDEQGYVAVTSLRSREDMARSAVLSELHRVEAALDRARGIARVLGMEDELDDIIDRVNRFRESVAPDAGNG